MRGGGVAGDRRAGYGAIDIRKGAVGGRARLGLRVNVGSVVHEGLATSVLSRHAGQCGRVRLECVRSEVCGHGGIAIERMVRVAACARGATPT